MKKIIKINKKALKKFNMFDIGVLKICLFSIGAIAAVYFTDFFSSIIFILWAIFAFSWLFLVFKVYISNNEEK